MSTVLMMIGLTLLAMIGGAAITAWLDGPSSNEAQCPRCNKIVRPGNEPVRVELCQKCRRDLDRMNGEDAC